jgi:hypothetical protein
MRGGVLKADVWFEFLASPARCVAHLIATVELTMRFSGDLPEMKVMGLALWQAEGAVTITLPAGAGTAEEYYCIRPVSGDVRDLVRFKQHVIDAYHAWATARPGSGDNP